jgi:hypothetical protein
MLPGVPRPCKTSRRMTAFRIPLHFHPRRESAKAKDLSLAEDTIDNSSIGLFQTKTSFSFLWPWPQGAAGLLHLLHLLLVALLAPVAEVHPPTETTRGEAPRTANLLPNEVEVPTTAITTVAQAPVTTTTTTTLCSHWCPPQCPLERPSRRHHPHCQLEALSHRCQALLTDQKDTTGQTAVGFLSLCRNR